MMCLSCIDIIASAVVGLPVLTMVYGAYCVFCELKSVMETTHEKEQIRNDLRELIELSEGVDELKELIRKLIK